MRAGHRLAWVVLAAVTLGGTLVAQSGDRRQLERFQRTIREEGEAVLALADAAAAAQALPADFALEWHNDFFKARQGTFVPFIVRIAPPPSRPPAALLYVRAVRYTAPHAGDEQAGRARESSGEPPSYPFEDIYPIELTGSADAAVRFVRGFVLQPGDYDVIVVVRERAGDGGSGRKRLAGVIRRRLTVPDFATNELTMSTVVLADRITPVSEPPSPEHLVEDPYVIGGRRVEPAADAQFRRDEELIVVFLVYRPAVGLEKQFDIEVEYHFFSRSGSAEAYLNRTEPQRFNPDVLGPSFDPVGGQPVMAGQGVPLAGFAPGDYRLQIKVTDRVGGRTIERDVAFTVVS